MSAEDVERLRAGFEAFSRGDLETALAGISPDFVLNDGVIVEDTTDLRGEAAVVESQRQLREGFGEIAYEPLELIDLEGRVVVRVRVRVAGATTGITFDQEVGQIWELRGGVAVRCDVFPSWDEARQAAGI